MAEIDDAIQEIQDVLGALSGIRGAPDYPPEEINAFPFIVCYPSSGVFAGQTPETLIGLHNLRIDLHLARKDLPRDVQKANEYSNVIPNALYKAFKNSTFVTIQAFDRIGYEFAVMGWAGTDTIGYRFTMYETKIVTVIT